MIAQRRQSLQSTGGTVPPLNTGQRYLKVCIKPAVSETFRQERHNARIDEIEQALGRVLTGHAFRSSAQCQALLRYIVEHSLTQENEMLRERIIGINVFGRAPDYDSGNDPIVRARAAEVRKRLAQHYMHGEGTSEELRIEIPSGSYRAIFATRANSESSETRHESEKSDELPATSVSHSDGQRDDVDNNTTKADISTAPETLEQHGLHRWRWFRGRLTSASTVLASVAALMAVLGFVAGYLATVHRLTPQRDVQGLQSAATDDPVAAFWAPFVKQDRSPIIAYADAMFLIDGTGDLFRFRHGASDNRGVSVNTNLARQFAVNPDLVANAGPLFYDNGYTGTGDLRAMAMLITQLAHQGATPLIESSYDISTDDLKQHNVILLGSSAENLAVAQLVPAGDFLFEGPTSSRDPWSDQIFNSQPRPGEQSRYATVRDPVTHGLQEDYALISFQPGITPEHQIAILGGIDTTGTEGAALLVTSKAGVEEITNAMSHDKALTQSGKSQSFQALVAVDVKKGYQVLGAQLITIHPLNVPKRPATRGSSSP